MWKALDSSLWFPPWHLLIPLLPPTSCPLTFPKLLLSLPLAPGTSNSCSLTLERNPLSVHLGLSFSACFYGGWLVWQVALKDRATPEIYGAQGKSTKIRPQLLNIQVYLKIVNQAKNDLTKCVLSLFPNNDLEGQTDLYLEFLHSLEFHVRSWLQAWAPSPLLTSPLSHPWLSQWVLCPRGV